MDIKKQNNQNLPVSEHSLDQFSKDERSLLMESDSKAAPDERLHPWEKWIPLSKFTLFIISLYLFMLAVVLMKDGACGVASLVRDSFSVTNAVNSLGFGWLFAYIIMSGSPVAAAAVAFFDAGVIDKLGAFAMITGSRLGASIIVLFIGFLYVLRGRDRATSLSMGVLSLTVTAIIHGLGFFPGMVILKTGWLDGFQLRSGALLRSVINLIVSPITNLAYSLLPNWVIFLIGLGIVWLSFKLFDKCLPQMTIKTSRVGRMSRLVYHPVVMFCLGALITSISMSVSLSLSILVPLSARGFVRRENVIPYIMGANITTFIDTLLATVLLNNPDAFTVVFVEMVSISIVSLIILLIFYHGYHRTVLKFMNWVITSNRNLGIYVIALFVVPILLMLI